MGLGGSLASETLRVLLVRREHLWTCGKGMGVRRVQAQSAEVLTCVCGQDGV